MDPFHETNSVDLHRRRLSLLQCRAFTNIRCKSARRRRPAACRRQPGPAHSTQRSLEAIAGKVSPAVVPSKPSSPQSSTAKANRRKSPAPASSSRARSRPVTTSSPIITSSANRRANRSRSSCRMAASSARRPSIRMWKATSRSWRSRAPSRSRSQLWATRTTPRSAAGCWRSAAVRTQSVGDARHHQPAIAAR